MKIVYQDNRYTVELLGNGQCLIVDRQKSLYVSDRSRKIRKFTLFEAMLYVLSL